MSLELLSHRPAWKDQFEAERARLMSILGYCTEGGVIYDLEHIGSTAVPGLTARPVIDIAVDAHPLPLSDEQITALVGEGYVRRATYAEKGQWFSRTDPFPVNLYVVSSDLEVWSRLLVVRDYLQAHQDVKERFSRFKQNRLEASPDDLDAYERGKHNFLGELEPSALRWHVTKTGFTPVENLAAELEKAPFPWFVASGWALDLFAGEPSRYHHDLDLSVWYDDQLELRQYLLEKGWRLHRVADEGTYVEWEESYRLNPPYHQVHARRDGDFLDILLNPKNENDWIYRRDADIKRPLSEAVMRSRGVAHLAPELLLLFKSTTRDADPRPRDQQDFEHVLPHLSAERKTWLRQALVRTRPDHPWLSALD